MICFFLGLPGSGKTYYAVNTIYNNFSDDKSIKKDLKKDYINCYTNINEFDFKKYDNVNYLDFQELYKKLKTLYRLYSSKADDSELIEKAKELNIYKTFFVVDEAHNYFGKEEEVLVWWLSYHRHMFHDIYLITQNLALVNAKYKPLSEFFYRAKPSSLILNKMNFVYTHYVDKSLSNPSKVGDIKVRKRKEVFELYKSGDAVVSDNVIVKFIKITFFVVVVLVIMGYYFYNSFTSDIEAQRSQEHISQEQIDTSINSTVSLVNSTRQNTNVQNNTDILDLDSQTYVVLNCSLSHCSNRDLYLPSLMLKKFIDLDLVSELYSEKINNVFYVIHYRFDNNLYNFLKIKRSDKNEKDTNSGFNMFGSTSE